MSRMDVLLSAYIDGEADAGQLEELADMVRRDTGARSEFLDAVGVHGLIRAAHVSDETRRMLQEDVFGRISRRRGGADERAARPLRWRAWGAIAACLAIIAGSLVYNQRRSTPSVETGVLVAHIEATAPDVWIIRGDRSIIAVLDMPLYTGDRITAGRGRSATFAYEGEETTISIQGSTILHVGGVRDGTRLRLEKGVLDAAVDPQPSGRPMIITTPHAEVEVKGTVFRLAVGTVPVDLPLSPAEAPGRREGPARGKRTVRGTRIDVAEGLVTLTRLSDGASVEVAGEQCAVAAEGAELRAQARRPARRHIDEDPRPLIHLYGKILFEDDFGDGLDKWEVVVGKRWKTDDLEVSSDEGLALIQRDIQHKGRNVESCVHLNPSPEDTANLFIGIRSKKRIEAERFVVEVRSCLTRRTALKAWVGQLGIEPDPDSEGPARMGSLHVVTQSWMIRRWDFVPARDPDRPGEFLAAKWDQVDRRGTNCALLQYLKSESGRVVLGSWNVGMVVDRVVVREIAEEPTPGETAGTDYVDGRVLFRDDFSGGLDAWHLMVQGLVTDPDGPVWRDLQGAERDCVGLRVPGSGDAAACMLMDAVQLKGRELAVCPTLTLRPPYAVEFDIRLEDRGVFNTIVGRPGGNSHPDGRQEAGPAEGWTHVRAEVLPWRSREGGVYGYEQRRYIDGKPTGVWHGVSDGEHFLITHWMGSARIDNVVVRELVPAPDADRGREL